MAWNPAAFRAQASVLTKAAAAASFGSGTYKAEEPPSETKGRWKQLFADFGYQLTEGVSQVVTDPRVLQHLIAPEVKFTPTYQGVGIPQEGTTSVLGGASALPNIPPQDPPERGTTVVFQTHPSGWNNPFAGAGSGSAGGGGIDLGFILLIGLAVGAGVFIIKALK